MDDAKFFNHKECADLIENFLKHRRNSITIEPTDIKSLVTAKTTPLSQKSATSSDLQFLTATQLGTNTSISACSSRQNSFDDTLNACGPDEQND